MGAWEITTKDLRLLVRDRRTLAVLLALPLIFISILGGTTGKLLGWKEENQLLKIAVADESKSMPDPSGSADVSPSSRLSVRVIADLQQNPGLSIERVESRAAAKKMVADGVATVAMFIGPAFEERVSGLRLSDLLNPAKGKLKTGLDSLDITFECQSSFSGTGAIVSQLVIIPVLRVITPVVAKTNAFTKGIVERSDEAAEQERLAGVTPTGAEMSPQTSKNDIIYREVVPSYTVMFVFFLVNIMARSFISEREMGTLRRLRIAPITSGALLVGKTVPFLVVSLVQSVLLFLFGRVMFGMSWGNNPWLLAPIIICTSMAATSMGLLVATVVRTDQQVSAYANFIVITMAGISGCFMPRDWLPPIMQDISLGTPHAWALKAYHAALNADVVNVTTVFECCTMLAGFATLFFCLGWWRFRYVD